MAVKTSWAAGDVLTAADLTDTFAAKGDGLFKRAAQTFTNQATVSLNNVFTSGWTNYRIVIRAETLAGTADINMRLRGSGSDLTTSTYAQAGVAAYDAGTPTIVASSTGSATIAYWRLCTGSNQYYFTIDLFDPQVADVTYGLHQSLRRGSLLSIYGSIGNTSSAGYDGLTIYASTGNITGNIAVFGYNKG